MCTYFVKNQTEVVPSGSASDMLVTQGCRPQLLPSSAMALRIPRGACVNGNSLLHLLRTLKGFHSTLRQRSRMNLPGRDPRLGKDQLDQLIVAHPVELDATIAANNERICVLSREQNRKLAQ
jgi:hypothetical protein